MNLACTSSGMRKAVLAMEIEIMTSQAPTRLWEKWLYLIQKRPRVFLLILALLTRIPALFVVFGSHHYVFASEGNDGYFQIAQNVATQGVIGFDAHHLLTRGPLYPLMLAPGFLLQHAIL